MECHAGIVETAPIPPLLKLRLTPQSTGVWLLFSGPRATTVVKAAHELLIAVMMEGTETT